MSERRRKRAAMAAALELLREAILTEPQRWGSARNGAASGSAARALDLLRAAGVYVGFPRWLLGRRPITIDHRHARTRLALYLRTVVREEVGS